MNNKEDSVLLGLIILLTTKETVVPGLMFCCKVITALNVYPTLVQVISLIIVNGGVGGEVSVQVPVYKSSI